MKLTIEEFFAVVAIIGGGIMVIYEIYSKVFKKPLDKRFDGIIDAINEKISNAIIVAIQPLTYAIDKLTLSLNAFNERIGKVELADELQKKEIVSMGERVARVEEKLDFTHKRVNGIQKDIARLSDELHSN